MSNLIRWRDDHHMLPLVLAASFVLVVAIGADQAGEEAADRIVQIPDLGPWQGACGSSAVYIGDRHRRVLLRSAKPLAARLQREHQWPAAAVLPQGDRPIGPLPGTSEQGGSPAEWTAAQDLGVPNASG